MTIKTAITPEKVLTSAVAQAGTFTLDYPVGFVRRNFAGGSRRVLGIAPVSNVVSPQSQPGPGASWSYRVEGTDFEVTTLGATEITVTWNNATSIPANSRVKLELPLAGDFDDEQNIVLGDRVFFAGHLCVLDLGRPAAPNTAYFRAAAAIGGAGNITLLQSLLDVPRNITFTSAGDDTGDTFTITGRDEYGAVVVENVTGANAATAAGKKAFASVTTISTSGASAGNVSIGFGDVLGLPAWVPSAGHVVKEIESDAAAVAGTLVAGLVLTGGPSTAITADVRGTYDPNSACDGVKTFELLVWLRDPNFRGLPQFAG